MIDLGDGSDGSLLVNGVVSLQSDRTYQFTDVVVQNGGVLTGASWDGNTGGTLRILVTGTFLVEPGGAIDLTGNGYRGGAPNPKIGFDYPNMWTNGGGSDGYHGEGPGAGGGGWSAPQATVGSGGGGSYGSPGTDGTYCGLDSRDFNNWDPNDGVSRPISNPLPQFSAAGPVYGTAELNPIDMGSGGGSGANNYDGGADGVGGAGGSGGGALEIAALEFHNQGMVMCNGAGGEPGVNGSFLGGGGGGSGGSIYLAAVTLTNDGSIEAVGGPGAPGNSGQGGAGGDGRIRLDYETLDQNGSVAPAAGYSEIIHCVGGMYTFSGVQQDVPEASLIGWTQCWSGTYGNNEPLAGILAACDGDTLLLGCRPVGDPNLTLAAMGPRADVLFECGTTGDCVHQANGVGWYYSTTWSWGFAPGGEPVNRDNCDYNTGAQTLPELRMCWHTGAGNITSGYRCGSNDLRRSPRRRPTTASASTTTSPSPSHRLL